MSGPATQSVPALETGRHTVVGYYRESNRYYEMRDREGTIVGSDEAGLEPSLMSPIDVLGPGILGAGARAITFEGLGHVFRRGVTVTVMRCGGNLRCRSLGGTASS